MSNDLTGNPYIIDTASGTALTTMRLKVCAIRWYAPGAVAGNACLVTSSGGQTLWRSVATGANYAEADHWAYDAPLIADGLVVSTLEAGTLFIQFHH